MITSRATASRDKTAVVWKVGRDSALVEQFRLPSPSGRPILRVAFDGRGDTLGMLVQKERAVRLWKLDRLRVLFRDLGIERD
jgi:hypothetical protein